MLARHLITALKKEARIELQRHPADFAGQIRNAAEFVYFRAVRDNRIETDRKEAGDIVNAIATTKKGVMP